MKKLILFAASALLLLSCGGKNEMPEVLKNLTFDQALLERQYKLNKAEWDAAFAFLSRPDLDTLTAGPWHQLTPETRGRVQLVTTHEPKRYEVHKKYVDVFYVLDGNDRVRLSSFDNLSDPTKPYNEENDCQFFETSSSFSDVVMTNRQGVVIFPPQGHMSNLCVTEPEQLKVIVIKVPYVY